MKKFTGHTGRIDCLAWSKNDELLLSACRDKTMRLWSLLDDCCKRVFEHKQVVNFCSFLHSDVLLLSATEDGSTGALRIWDTESGKLLRELGVGSMQRCAVGPRNNIAVVCSSTSKNDWSLIDLPKEIHKPPGRDVTLLNRTP